MKLIRRLLGARPQNDSSAAGAVPCKGCGRPPLLTYNDPPDNAQAHLNCVNPRCPAPVWTSTPPGVARTVEQAVTEWNLLNGGGA